MNSLSDYLDGPVNGRDDEKDIVFLEATVAENAHKDHPGMVKVEYPAFTEGKKQSAWIPLLTHYAGNEHGAYLVPEIGDTVVVAFIGPDLQKPFVLGSFYPAGAKIPTDCFDEKNLVRHFRTKGGISIAIQDDENKQTVEVTTPKGLSVKLDDEKDTLSLTDQEKKNSITLDSANNKLSLQCDSNLVLKAGKCEISLDGSSGKVTVSCSQMEFSADQSAAISAGTNLSMEGAIVKVEGKQTAALKGSSMTEVSGGVLKLN